jgi:SPP1 gp7 family putative phage head morphogenesis protein
MAYIPNRIHSASINQMVDVTRFEAGLRADIRRMLDKLGQGLVSDLLGAGLDTPRTAWQQARLRSLAAQAQARITETYGLIDATMADQMQGLIQVGSNGIVSAINGAIGAKLLVPIQWTPEMLAKLAGSTLIEGAPSAEWWSRQADGLGQAFTDEMRQGLLRGETITQLRDRIMGQNIPGVDAAGNVDLRTVAKADRGMIWTARRNAGSLVRTSVISTANDAHMAAFQANSDIVKGVQWMSTLDNRTTPQCRALDGKMWDLRGDPIEGNVLPYPGATAHWGCRSTQIAVTKSWEELARAAGGDTRLARELDKIPGVDRASMGGPVSGDSSYETWFSNQSTKRQVNILGPGKHELWKKGQLGFTDMVDQSGNPLSLDELRRNLGDSRAKTKGLEDALLTIETKTRRDALETAHLFTPEGEKVWSKQGNRSSVGFTQQELAQFKGNVLTHNHPRGSSFSPEDIALACKYDLAEIRASGSVARYSMAPPEGGWNQNLWNKSIHPMMKKVDGEIHDEFMALIRRGELDVEQACIRHWDEVWTRVSKELHLNYVREEWV